MEIKTETVIVNGLSELIAQSLRTMERERHAPGRDADRMDDTIKFHRERAATLRSLRERFEDEMSRPQEAGC